MGTNNSPQELEHLYELARNARAEGNDDQAWEYYQKIAEVDKGNWEAVFYSNYSAYHPPFLFTINRKNFKDADDQTHWMGSLLLTTVDVIAAQQDIDKNAALTEIYFYYYDHCKDWEEKLRSLADDLQAGNTFAADNNVSIPVAFNYLSCLAMLYAKMSYEFGDAIVSNGLNFTLPSGLNIAADCWKKGDYFMGFSYATATYPDYKFSQKYLSEYGPKIRQFEPDYQQPVLPKPKKKSGCYIATCVYGSYDCPQVWTLRRYRDEALSKKVWGRAFIRAYYAVSPTLVRWFGSCKWFSGLFRPMLDSMVDSLMSKGYENTPYQDR